MPMPDQELAVGANGVAEGVYTAGMGGTNGAECSDDQQRAQAGPTTGEELMTALHRLNPRQSMLAGAGLSGP